MKQNDFAVMNTSDARNIYNDMMDRIEAMKPEIPMRDWFAGLAMQGILANEAMIDGINDNVSKWITAHAYQLADAMMKERDK
jgi:hypothetical protein